jgi:SPP1 gp7 family putative phage head morphogenesis protein
MPLSESFWLEEQTRILELIIEIWVESGVSGAWAVIDVMNEADMPAVDEAIIFGTLMDWIRINSPSEAALIMSYTREAVEKALALWDGEDPEQLAALLEPIFSEVRAETIALNESIAGISIGNLLAWQAYDIIEEVVWRTQEDEKVCPVCRPLDGVVIPLEEAIGGFFPPAATHPRCRCYLEPVLVLSRSMGLVNALFAGRVTIADLERVAYVQ